MADPADQAQYYLEQQELIREQQRLARQASEMQALATLACVDCGEDIEPLRKQAIPEADKCFDCQSADEIRQRNRLR
jgi:RNA polymerase-binding transcription factor DksA